MLLRACRSLAFRPRPAATLAAASCCPHGRSISIAVPGVARALSDITHLDLLESEPPARISAVWEAFHEGKRGVAGKCVDLAEYELIMERGAESPMFVFPVRRDKGHFMLLSQFTRADRMFVLTSLAEYQQSVSMAQPWASVHLFEELLTAKAIAPMRSEVVPERLTNAEAEHLLLLIRRYYGTPSYDKVWMFNHAEKRFDLDAYLKTCP